MGNNETTNPRPQDVEPQVEVKTSTHDEDDDDKLEGLPTGQEGKLVIDEGELPSAASTGSKLSPMNTPAVVKRPAATKCETTSKRRKSSEVNSQEEHQQILAAKNIDILKDYRFNQNQKWQSLHSGEQSSTTSTEIKQEKGNYFFPYSDTHYHSN